VDAREQVALSAYDVALTRGAKRRQVQRPVSRGLAGVARNRRDDRFEIRERTVLMPEGQDPERVNRIWRTEEEYFDGRAG
jgi:hypothetical protein